MSERKGTFLTRGALEGALLNPWVGVEVVRQRGFRCGAAGYKGSAGLDAARGDAAGEAVVEGRFALFGRAVVAVDTLS